MFLAADRRGASLPLGRVLVCEDEGLTVLRLEVSLERLGYEVVGAVRSGEEAVAAAERLKPDAILMDVNMPELDGIEATRRIMRRTPTAIVMLTAYSQREVVREALEAGATGFLVKPVADEQLGAALSSARERYAEAHGFRELIRDLEEAGALQRGHSERASRRNRQLEQELEQERTMSRALVQAFLPPTPAVPGFRIASRYEPASGGAPVGGDYYDFIPLDGGRLGIVIGDVCGKGTPAAAYAAMARHMLRAYVAETPSPARAMTRLNRVLCGNMSEECSFLTMVYGIVDPRAGRFTYANGGHSPPVLCRRDAGICRELNATGGMLGFLPEMEFARRSVSLTRDGVLVLFTDGITEARISGARLFGHDGVRRVVRENLEADAGSIADALLDAARRFAGGVLQDDAAIVVLKQE